MGVVIPAGFAMVSYGTLTPDDPELMYWTCGLDVSITSDPADLLSDLVDAWDSNLAAITSQVVTLQNVHLKYGPNDTGPFYDAFPGTLGQDTQSLPPPNCAVLVRKITTSGGKRGRGRAYLPGISHISATLDSAGNFGAVVQGDVTDAMEGWRGDVTAGDASGGAPPVLLHSDGGGPDTITAFACESKLATQRRRLRP